jgi:outer membrane protein OmpA-like peptidoglycan-associated protein
MQLRRCQQVVIFSSIFVATLAWSPSVFADDHIKGVISARGADGSLTVRTDDASSLTVMLTDVTKVRRVDGARQLKASSSSLIPGLRVKADGDFNGASRFVAQRVTFSRSDMKTALAIKGGVDPTDLRSLDNQRRIEQNAQVIAQQQQTLTRQADQIASNRDHINANQAQIVATTGALDNTNARIANLDGYSVVSTVVVYFRNGSAAIEPKYKTQLQQLAAQAKDTNGYMVQVQGYASAVGSNAANQKLSMSRADAVTAELQQGGIAPPNVVVPAAMGISQQVATNKTAKGQAENRRTVVTLLQNKGISDQ